MRQGDKLDREFPSSKPAEEAILGTFLQNPNELYNFVDSLDPEYFFFTDLKRVYRVMLEALAAGDKRDFISLSEKLNGNEELLTRLVMSACPVSNIPSHVKLIRDKKADRDAILLGQTLINMGFENIDSDKILGYLTTAAMKFGVDSKSTLGMGDMLSNYLTELDMRIQNPMSQNLPTGLNDFDYYVGGLLRQELAIVAARPGVGKTTLVTQILNNMAKNDKNVLFFSLEMSQHQLIERLISIELGINANKLRFGTLTEDEYSKVIEAMGYLQPRTLFINDKSGVGLSFIQAEARKLHLRCPIDCIAVDYVTLMAYNRDNEVSELGIIAKGLRALAKELNCAMILISQLSRGVEGRPDKRPTLSDLRASGELEQDADKVMFLFRPGFYNKNYASDETYLYLDKNRSGDPKEFRLAFNSQNLQFDGAENSLLKGVK